jgi:two-component system, sensor histidine kinase
MIIVADDYQPNQLLLKFMLKELGYSADIANNGEEVLAMLAQRRYDLIFMDVQMPRLDGLETTRMILEKYPPEQLPIIIAITADDEPEDVNRCLTVGMNDFLSKPIDINDLENILYKWYKR